MNITLALGDFLAIAAIVVFFVRGYHGHRAGHSPQELRMQRQVDAMMKHLGLPEPPMSRAGALSPQVAYLVATGRRLEAIRLYRQETGESLKDARLAVQQYPA